MPMSTASSDAISDPFRSSKGKRAGHEIPGYQGYIPGKLPEADVFGKSFNDTNRQVADGKRANTNDRIGTAKVSLSQEVHGNAHHARDDHKGTRKLWRGSGSATSHHNWSPKADRGAAPGYCGYIPNKVEDVYGTTFNKSNDNARTGRAGDTRHGEELAENKVKSAVDLAQSSRVVRDDAPVHKKATTAIPHYSGHIPGKKAENIVGATFGVSNSKATQEFKALINDEEGPNRDPWRRCSAPGVEARRHAGAAPGKAIPHYAGYVPGKRPEAGVCGMTWAASSQFADDLHQHGREVKKAMAGTSTERPMTAREPRGSRGSMSSRASQSEASLYTRSDGSQSYRGPQPPPGISLRGVKDTTLGAGGYIPGYQGHKKAYASSGGGSGAYYKIKT